MINLLSPEERKQIKAARANSILMRYVVMSLIVVVIIIVELISSYFMLVFNQSTSRETINDNQSKSSAFSSVKSDAEKYRSNLRVAKYILDTQAPYTDILNAIAKRLPNGASLTGISIDPTTFGTACKFKPTSVRTRKPLKLKIACKRRLSIKLKFLTVLAYQTLRTKLATIHFRQITL